MRPASIRGVWKKKTMQTFSPRRGAEGGTGPDLGEHVSIALPKALRSPAGGNCGPAAGDALGPGTSIFHFNGHTLPVFFLVTFYIRQMMPFCVYESVRVDVFKQNYLRKVLGQ